jgi:hypothetical protein
VVLAFTCCKGRICSAINNSLCRYSPRYSNIAFTIIL